MARDLMGETTRVYLEVGKTWVFAAALDWPGWCRRGRGEEAAIDTLLDYADRYAPVAGDGFALGELSVVGRVTGTMSTDFGAPDAHGPWDDEPLSPAEAARQAGLLDASWRYFDRVVHDSPAELRKGPRGGGRDRDGIADHVREAERSYGRKVGPRVPPRTPGGNSAPPSSTRCAPARPAAPGRRDTPPGAAPGTCSTTRGRSRTAAAEAFGSGFYLECL